MISAVLCIAAALAAGMSGTPHAGAIAQSSEDASRPLRVAVAGFSGNAARGAEAAVSGSLSRDARVKLIDQSQVRPALAAIGYSGSINMTTEDARRMGAAIGCDFFVIGKAEVIARSERPGESHRQALVAVMIVDSRSGALPVFDLIAESDPAEERALGKAAAILESRAAGYIDRLRDFRAAQSVFPGGSGRSSGEVVEDVPDPDSPLAAGFKPPEFLNRVKPEYTQQADLADISATVEALAVFRSDGQVGDIEITRWAGFGLDQSAARAIRQLKFKPATRDGKPISVRATVRYNFRRINEAADDRR